MHIILKPLRQAVSAWLCALMLALSVMLPVYERADLGVVHALESQHHPGSCPRTHDHSICTQARANHLSTPARPPEHERLVVFAWIPVTFAPAPAPTAFLERARARAPPVV